MSTFVTRIAIAAPPAVVWDVMTRFEKWPEWTASIRSVTPLAASPPGLGALLVTPWLARNLLVFDTLAMSAGPYGGRTLMQRAAYNDMRWDEFGAAFLFWLPDFGIPGSLK